MLFLIDSTTEKDFDAGTRVMGYRKRRKRRASDQKDVSTTIKKKVWSLILLQHYAIPSRRRVLQGAYLEREKKKKGKRK